MDNVLWIEGSEPVGLAIVLRPRGEKELKEDLADIKRSGVKTLVSMLEPNEARWLGLADEGPLAEEAGMHFLSYPILDVHVPADVTTFREFVAGSGGSSSLRETGSACIAGEASAGPR